MSETSPSRPPSVSASSRIIRVRRKRSAHPQNALLLLDSNEEVEDNEMVAGPSKKYRADESTVPSAFRLIGTLPMPDVGNAARLFLPKQTPAVVELVGVEDILNGSDTPVVSVNVDNVQDILMQNVEKVSVMNLEAEVPVDPFLAIPDEAPLADPEPDLDDETDYVYDFYHCESSKPTSSKGRVHVRLPTDTEMQMYFGGDEEDSDEDAGNGERDEDADSNAENYYKNDYPDEDDFGNDLENDTTSDDSYDHYGDENERFYQYGSKGGDGDANNSSDDD